MSSYQVGQIVYVVLKKKMAVQPFRIVEIITKKTLAGEETNYRLQGGPDSSKTQMLDQIEGEIFETPDEVRRVLVERAFEQIYKIVDASMAMSFDWFDSTKSPSAPLVEKTIHELPEPKENLSNTRIKSATEDEDDATAVMMPDEIGRAHV